ncbi:MAG TPA: hypothetical protein H9752_00635 [Candidatus Phocaeicola excrementigallinarum]|nr:hypothetical protein [Candidatus Phocaeicola excrementigallinarum]
MKKKYVAPQTEMSEVELESGFMAGSRDKVVTEDNTDVSIDKQKDGGSFELDTWNESNF